MARIVFTRPPNDRYLLSTIGTGMDPANPHTWDDLAAKLNSMTADLYGQVMTTKQFFGSPLPADNTTMVNAVTPSNVALTIAAQPPQARKLNVHTVIGTTTTTAITAGNLALVYIDQDGNSITDNISLIMTTTTDQKSSRACAKLISATVSAYAANGSGTGNTVGIGPTNDFGIATGQGVVSNFSVVKASKITKVLGTSNVVADDVASTTTVDTAARTVVPTTNPTSGGLIDFEFTCSYLLAA